jgi:hypothetical protein
MKRPVPALALAALVLAIGSPAAATTGARPAPSRLLVKFEAGADVSGALSAASARPERTIPDIDVHVVSVGSDHAPSALVVPAPAPAPTRRR